MRARFSIQTFITSVVIVAAFSTAVMAQSGGDNTQGDGEAAKEEDAKETTEEEETARLRFKTGQKLYEAGKFVEAAAEFEKAYELAPHPELLYNAYLAWRDAGDQPKAAAALERYLITSDSDAHDRGKLEKRLAVLKASLAEKEEDEAEKKRLAEEAEQAKKDAQEAREEAKGPGPLPWVLGGGGILSAVVGLVIGAGAAGKVQEIKENCPDNRCVSQYTNLDADRNTARALATTADIFLVIGVGLVTAGTVLLLTHKRSKKSASIVPVCSDTACGVFVSGSF